VLIIHPLLQENVTIELLKCPILLEGLFDDIPERKVSLIDVTSSTQLIKLNFSSKTAKTTIMPHLTNICHFLQARGYWADAIGKCFIILYNVMVLKSGVRRKKSFSKKNFFSFTISRKIITRKVKFPIVKLSFRKKVKRKVTFTT
jgi:hypothetical protein